MFIWKQFSSLACFKHHLNKFNIPSYSIQGTNIFPKNGILKIIFLFPRWDMLIPWRVFHPFGKDCNPLPFPCRRTAWRVANHELLAPQATPDLVLPQVLQKDLQWWGKPKDQGFQRGLRRAKNWGKSQNPKPTSTTLGLDLSKILFLNVYT